MDIVASVFSVLLVVAIFVALIAIVAIGYVHMVVRDMEREVKKLRDTYYSLNLHTIKGVQVELDHQEQN